MAPVNHSVTLALCAEFDDVRCAECTAPFFLKAILFLTIFLPQISLAFIFRFRPRRNQSCKRHAVSVYTFLFLMCLFPLEEAGW